MTRVWGSKTGARRDHLFKPPKSSLLDRDRFALDCVIHHSVFPAWIIALLRNREGPTDHAAVAASRVEPYRPERGSVCGVGKRLGLECHEVSHAGEPIAMAGDGAVERVARIELQPGLVGVDGQAKARPGVFEPGHRTALAGRAVAQHPVVIESPPDPEFFFGPDADPVPDAGGLSKVERGSGNGPSLTRRDQAVVYRQEEFGCDCKPVPQRRAAASDAGEVPVRVVRKVDERRRIGGRRVFDAQPVALQAIGRFDL